MTWIPCGQCHSCPCQCAWRPTPYVPYVPYQATNTYTLTPFQRLTDEEIERIARRVAELLKEPAR